MKNDIILRCGIEVIEEENAIEKIGNIVEKYYSIGNICVIYDKNTKEIADIISKQLGDFGYSVYIKRLDDDEDIPLCVKYILGVGSGKVADEVKFVAKRMDIGFSLFATAPSTESYVFNKINNLEVIEEVPLPNAIIIDNKIIEQCPDFLVAGGYGRIIAQLVSIFDIEFRRVIFAQCQDDELLDELTALIYDFEKKKYDEHFNIRLIDTLIKIGDIKNALNIDNEAVDEVARVIGANSEITEGEASFLASFMILHIYKFFLENECIDTIVPPDIVKNLKLLEKCKVINYNNYVSELAISKTFVKETFILEEYRRDLLDKLKGVDMRIFARFWRRLYDDAGFWLKSYLSGQELLKYLALSAELSNGTLLKYIKRLGYFEKLI